MPITVKRRIAKGATWLLSAVAGQGASEPITAAVLLFRVAQWLGPIPIGWLLLLAIRGRGWMASMAGRQ